MGSTTTEGDNYHFSTPRHVPYIRDMRPLFLKLFHVLVFVLAGALLLPFKNQRMRVFMWLDRCVDNYLIPIEPYTDKYGRWYRK